MLLRGMRRLAPTLSAILILGTSLATPAMALMAAEGRTPAGHHHHSEHDMPGHTPANSCCDICWTGCATAPGVPPIQTLPDPPVTLCVSTCPWSAGLPAALLIRHRLPFSQAPPALLV